MSQLDRLNGLFKSLLGRRRFAASLSFAILILLFVSGCADNSSVAYKNPDFSCPSSKIVESSVGYPYPIQQYPVFPTTKSVADLKEFCSQMKQLFAESNLTVSEASQFYALLEETKGKELSDGNQLFLHNECYGMPACDVEPFIMNKQVMLRKITDNEYELFFYHIGCGINYTHLKIRLEHGAIIGITRVEVWSESNPC